MLKSARSGALLRDHPSPALTASTAPTATPVPYPGVAELTALAKQLCWADRLIGPWADPGGQRLHYYALIPSEDLWNGENLPKDWKSDQNIYCVMTNSAGQLPGDS